jgi:hypothetical protein
MKYILGLGYRLDHSISYVSFKLVKLLLLSRTMENKANLLIEKQLVGLFKQCNEKVSFQFLFK